MSKEIYILTLHTDDKEWTLKNWKEIINWYNLPFYKKWFIKCPIKEFIEIKKPKQNTKLKEQVKEEKLTLIQGYYNWIYLEKPSIDNILDRFEIERKQLITNKTK